MAASGKTPDGKANVARRVIFKEDKCNSCHDRLGTKPYLHDGTYNIAMCAICHTPNQGGNTGWSASFRVWVHGIHAASKRTIADTWHDMKYDEVAYPGVLKNCETCHEAGTYDFSASQYTQDVMDNMLYVQAATGSSFNAANSAAPKKSDGTPAYGLVASADYGTGWSIDSTTGSLVAGTTQGLNLVSSPITAACTACHDDSQTISHVKQNGGSFYTPRTTALATSESCLVCHGSGKIADIKAMHAK
jgi:OmcA/MtrC family decaheme c-type cytochrome